MNQQDTINLLEPEWDRPDGFFAKLRVGTFDTLHAERILKLLRALDLGDGAHIDRRLVSLLWYLPSFCDWQIERVAEAGGDITAYKRFSTELLNRLEEKLGTP